MYRRPGVEQACLGLQDRLGADVNLVLFCCWLGREIDAQELDRVLAAVAPWQRDVVAPLRAVRRTLKPRLEISGDPGEGAGGLRQQIAASELEAEHREQAWLESRVRAVGPGEPNATAAIHNLKLYISRFADRPADADLAALFTILAAAFPDHAVGTVRDAWFATDAPRAG